MAILISTMLVSVISEKAALCANLPKLWKSVVKQLWFLLQKSPAHTLMYLGIPAVESQLNFSKILPANTQSDYCIHII